MIRCNQARYTYLLVEIAVRHNCFRRRKALPTVIPSLEDRKLGGYLFEAINESGQEVLRYVGI